MIVRKNQTIENLLNRTCCRQFRKQRVPDEITDIILKAGQAAPSAKNRQPWFFLVIKDKTLKQKIAQAAYLGRQSQFKNFANKEAKQMIEGRAFDTSNDASIVQADFAILVFRCSDPKYQEGDQMILELKEEQSVACACNNMLNAAYALGIGMYWNCSVLNYQEEILKLLCRKGVKLPSGVKLRVLLPGGYPKEKSIKPPRKRLVEISQWLS